MFEALRKLTANYTEAEYERWIESEPTPLPEVRGDERNKDIACMLADIADDTGYKPEFLYNMFDEVLKDYLEDGNAIVTARRKAFIEVAEIALERDY